MLCRAASLAGTETGGCGLRRPEAHSHKSMDALVELARACRPPALSQRPRLRRGCSLRSPCCREIKASPPISRVLSSASPAEAGTHRRGSHPSGSPVARRLKRPYPRTGRASRFVLLLGLAPGGVYRAGRSPGRWWALASTISPSPVSPPAVSFLWHSPSGYPDRVLPGTLLCGARTFLDRIAPAAAAWRTRSTIVSARLRFQASRCSAGINARVRHAETKVSATPTRKARVSDRWTSCPEMADPTGSPA